MGGTFCMLTTQANEIFGPNRIDELDASLVAPGTNLAEAAARMDLGTPAEREFLASFGPDLLDQARATIAYALEQRPRLPVVFFFSFGPDYALSIGAGLKPPGMHLVFTGPVH